MNSISMWLISTAAAMPLLLAASDLPIIEGTALGAMALAFILILRWMLGTFSRQMRAVEKSLNITSVAVMTLSQQLLRHDLTVTGLNPSTGDTPEARDSKAYVKYKEVQKEIEDLKHVVMDRATHVAHPSGL